MASYQIYNWRGETVGIATNSALVAAMASCPGMAGVGVAMDNQMTQLENFANSPEAKAIDRASAKFFLPIIIGVFCFVVVITTWCFALFFRTLMHSSVIKKYQIHCLITIGVGLFGLSLSIITLLCGGWHLSDGFGVWTWSCLTLTGWGILCLAISFVQMAISRHFPHWANNSGTGWPALFPAAMGYDPSFGWGLLQDAFLWLTIFVVLIAAGGFPFLPGVLFASIFSSVVLIPVWVTTSMYSLRVVKIDESQWVPAEAQTISG